MAAYVRQKGIGSSLSGGRANSVMRPAVVAKQSCNFKHSVQSKYTVRIHKKSERKRQDQHMQLSYTPNVTVHTKLLIIYIFCIYIFLILCDVK